MGILQGHSGGHAADSVIEETKSTAHPLYTRPTHLAAAKRAAVHKPHAPPAALVQDTVQMVSNLLGGETNVDNDKDSDPIYRGLPKMSHQEEVGGEVGEESEDEGKEGKEDHIFRGMPSPSWKKPLDMTGGKGDPTSPSMGIEIKLQTRKRKALKAKLKAKLKKKMKKQLKKQLKAEMKKHMRKAAAKKKPCTHKPCFKHEAHQKKAPHFKKHQKKDLFNKILRENKKAGGKRKNAKPQSEDRMLHKLDDEADVYPLKSLRSDALHKLKHVERTVRKDGEPKANGLKKRFKHKQFRSGKPLKKAGPSAPKARAIRSVASRLEKWDGHELDLEVKFNFDPVKLPTAAVHPVIEPAGKY